MSLLLTGGTGYIGSHTCVELIQAGYSPVLLDDLSNSSPSVVERIGRITGRSPPLVVADVCDQQAVARLFETFSIDAVLHFAGFKSVADSVVRPLDYYRNNVGGSLALLHTMREHGVTRIVFSSSATVYGAGAAPFAETAPTGPVNPYGRTKLVVEELLQEVAQAGHWNTICLRYFNPVGAHESGKIGEDPRDTPNNLMPYLAQVAAGQLPCLRVFGDDYPTVDGTPVRDYVHVSDVAAGHVAAVKRVLSAAPEHTVVNLGAGQGRSVLELLAAFERASGKSLSREIVGRRAGDVAVTYADVSRANSLLGWSAVRGLDLMCADAWRWQLNSGRR